eukprot:177526_1
MIRIIIIATCIYFGSGMVPAETNLNSNLSMEFVHSLPETIQISLHYVAGQSYFLRSRIDESINFSSCVHDVYYHQRDVNATSLWYKRHGSSLTQTNGLKESGGVWQELKDVVFISKLSDGIHVRSKIVNVNTPHEDITYEYPENIPNNHCAKMRNTITVNSNSRTVWSLFVQDEDGSKWIQKTNRKTWAVFPAPFNVITSGGRQGIKPRKHFLSQTF